MLNSLGQDRLYSKCQSLTRNLSLTYWFKQTLQFQQMKRRNLKSFKLGKKSKNEKQPSRPPQKQQPNKLLKRPLQKQQQKPQPKQLKKRPKQQRRQPQKLLKKPPKIQPNPSQLQLQSRHLCRSTNKHLSGVSCGNGLASSSISSIFG